MKLIVTCIFGDVLLLGNGDVIKFLDPPITYEVELEDCPDSLK